MEKSRNLRSLQSNIPPFLQTPPGKPEFVNLSQKHQCLVCTNVMRDAVMTRCGHRCCESCLPELYNPQNKSPVMCPGNEEICVQLKAEEIRGDNATRREIRSLSVYCTYRPYGCEEKVLWKDLKSHESQCIYKPVQCQHYGCQKQYRADDIQSHLRTCKYRPVKFNHCEEMIPYFQQAELEEKTCRKIIISCPFKCKEELMSREEMENHMESCPLRPQECKFKSMGCQFVGKQGDLERHDIEAADEHLQMIAMYTASMDLQCMEMRREIQDISSEREKYQSMMNNIQRHSNYLMEIVESVKAGQRELMSKIVEKTERINHLEKKVDNMAKMSQKEVLDKQLKESLNQSERSGFTGGYIGSQQESATGPLVTRVQQLNEQLGLQDIGIAEHDLRFQFLETASYNGILLWKIRDYYRRKQEAITGRTVSLYSQPFYTSRFGYKMCARLYLNGDGMGKGTHLSLFFVVMRSEYDAFLPWPFHQKVTLLLLDQDKGARHISDTFKPDTASSSYKRPTTDMNIASGCPLFVSHAVLETQTYLKDDAIFIKVVTDTEGINAQG